MTTVFISYRRDDASANAGRLCDWLKRQFGARNVFLDTESIAPGDTFPSVIGDRLGRTDVLVAVVGPHWATICDKDGNRRIVDPKDFVALEVSTGLRRGIRIVPVLVGGAKMPAASELPPALQGFETRNAVAIDDDRFAQDFDNLVDAIMSRQRGFARRELDRLQRGVRVLKASSLIAPGLALVLLFGAWTQFFDAFLLDTRIASYSMWLGDQFAPLPAETSVVIVAIDEDSEKRLRKYGRAPEWRSDHAKLIDRLVAAGVAAIAFDLWIESENDDEIAADTALAEAIRRAGEKGVRVIVGIRGMEGQIPRILPKLLAAGASTGSLCIGSRLGYAFSVPLAVSPDAPGKRDLRAANPALGLAAAFPGRAESIDEERREVVVRALETRHVAYSVLDNAGPASPGCPTLASGSVIASLLLQVSPSGFWREPQRRFSYSQVLDIGPAAAGALRGKTALIGVTLLDVGDLHRVVRGWKTDQIFGVELHADTIRNLEHGVATRPLGPTAQWLLMLALAIAGAAASFVLFGRSARHRALALAVAVLAYAGAAVALYALFDILLNVLYDVAAFAIAYAVLGYLQRRAAAAATGEASP